jgi:hypothetical protein
MSDDEDEYVNKKKTGRFVSYAPSYRSQEVRIIEQDMLLRSDRRAYRNHQMIDLLAAVDAVADPEPSNRYVARIQGPVRDEPPKISNKIENRARRWMVSEEWLEKDENLKYDTERRIIDSGKAWGDDEDPEVLVLQREKVKEEKKVLMASRKRPIVGQGSKKVKKQKRASGTQKSVKGKEKAQDPNNSSDEMSFPESDM